MLIFPLAQATLGDVLPIVSATFTLAYSQESARLASGEWLVADLAPPLWEADVTLKPLLKTEARAQAALLSALDGGAESFYLADPAGWWPKADPGGATLGSATPSINSIDVSRKALTITGLPAGYVLSAGDMFALDYGTPTRRALLRIVTGATADGTGLTSSIEIRPHLRPGILAGTALDFARPAAKMKIVPGSITEQPSGANRTVITFKARQTLAAG